MAPPERPVLLAEAPDALAELGVAVADEVKEGVSDEWVIGGGTTGVELVFGKDTLEELLEELEEEDELGELELLGTEALELEAGLTGAGVTDAAETLAGVGVGVGFASTIGMISVRRMVVWGSAMVWTMVVLVVMNSSLVFLSPRPRISSKKSRAGRRTGEVRL